MKRFAFLLVLAACTQPDEEPREPLTSPRQQPSVTEPGVHVSGYANVGVTRSY